jgi:adenylylsulfate kinase
MKIKATNVAWHEGHVDRSDRERLMGQRGATVWFTGLSASGKSTIAFTVEHALIERGHLAYVLDGDNVRHGLNQNLGFSAEDREENIRRIAEVTKLFADAGFISMTSFISPYRADRDKARALHDEAGLPFIEVHMVTSLHVCEQRDPKGLYKKARAGEVKQFTGVSDPYEPPLNADLTIDAGETSPSDAATVVLEYLERRGLVSLDGDDDSADVRGIRVAKPSSA